VVSMKGILLSGLLAFSPILGQPQAATSNLNNTSDINTQTNIFIQNLEQQFSNDISLLIQQLSDIFNIHSIKQRSIQVIQNRSQYNQVAVHGFVHRPGLNHRFPRQRVNQQTTVNGMQASQNWAGYIDTPSSNSEPYTSVSGTWTVPAVTGSQQGVAAQWIGLGGVSTQDLLQMGTIEDFEQGKAVANVFWEQLPQVAQNIMTVPIGSTIHGSISKSTDSTWNISFTANEPNGQTVSKTISVTLDSSYAQGIGTSAEWISEDPSNANGQLVPLANMGTVQYSQALVNGKSLNASGNQVQPVALVSATGNVLIEPSSVGSDGESFATQTLSTADNGQGKLQRVRRENIIGRHGYRGWGNSDEYGW
jgi:Peptidase A4 family